MLDAEEVAGLVIIRNLVVFEIDGGGGISDVESVALVGGDVGTLGGKDSFAACSVARHGLIEEDVFIGGGLAVQSIIGVGESGVFESDAVFTFNYDTFGGGGDEIGILYGNVGGGIDGRGAFAGSFVCALVDSDSAAATVGTDGSARGASGSNSEVFGIHNTATSSHDAARIVFGGFDGRVGNVDGGAVGSAVISSGGTAVAKDTIGAGGVGGDCGVFDV